MSGRPALHRLAGCASAAAGAAHLLMAPRQHGHGALLVAGFVVAGLAMTIAGWRLAATGGERHRRLTLVSCAGTAAAFAAFHLLALPGHHRHAPEPAGLAVTALELAAAALLVGTRSGGRLGPRRLAAAVAAAMVATSTVAVAAPTPSARPAGCVEPTRRMTLYAEELTEPGGPIRLGYGTSPSTASSPGPTIELVEGDCLAVTLVNNVPESTLQALRDLYPPASGDHGTPLGVSLHVHGLKYTSDSDGTTHTGSWVPPGASRTYTFYAAPPTTVGEGIAAPGTAGYWWYHDHVAGTSHGSGGLDAGLFGAVVVRRPGDPLPDRQYVVAMGPTPMLNMRSFPDTFTCDDAELPSTTCFVADAGERVEVVVFAVGNEFHTFHLHGHSWADTRTGLLASHLDGAAIVDARTVGPSESFGFQVIAGDSVGPGDWMLHCHVQSHSDAGMATFLRVRDAGVPVVDGSLAAGDDPAAKGPDGPGHGHEDGHDHEGHDH